MAFTVSGPSRLRAGTLALLGAGLMAWGIEAFNTPAGARVYAHAVGAEKVQLFALGLGGAFLVSGISVLIRKGKRKE